MHAALYYYAMCKMLGKTYRMLHDLTLFNIQHAITALGSQVAGREGVP